MSRVKRTLALITILLMPFILASCFFPEKFESEVVINKNGTFNFEYEGTLTFILGKAEEVKNGKLSAKVNRDIQALEKELKDDKGFKKVEYIGHSKFRVIYKKKGRLNTPFYFISKSVKLFSILPEKRGLIKVSGIRLSKENISQLKSINLSLHGVLTVKTDGKVVENNADSTPSLLGLIGGYSWKIKSMNDPTPKIVIKIN